MLPALRTTLRTVSYRNQPLQDILNTCKLSKEVIQVLPIQTELFNTILITRLKTGKIRTHYYNRLDLGQILKGIVVRGTSATDVIHELNTEQYCDFTEDDVEIIGKELVAKVDSLGYIGRHSLNGSEPSTGDNDNQEDQEPVPTDRVHIIPDLFYGYLQEGTLINPITWQLEIDRVLQDVIFTTDSPGVYIESWLSETYPMDYTSQWLEEGGVEGPELRKKSFGRADFRLIPSENPLPIIEEYALGEIYDASNNPTFNIDEDGIITFSLMGPPEPALPDLNNLVLSVSGGTNGEDVYIQNMYLFGEDGVDDLTISAEVDWGDGSPKETYVGNDIFSIYRYFEPWEQYYVSIKFNKTVPMFHVSGDAIVGVVSFGLNPITNLRLDYARNLVKLPEYLPPYMTSLERMFEDCGILNCPNISKWDVSHVTNFTSTFTDAYSFNQPLNDWDMSSAVTLDTMFYNASSFNQPLDKWNISNVKSLKLTFGEAYLFNQNINDWDTSNVENMWGVFYQAHNFNQPLDNWNTSKVTDMHGTFQETRAFNQDIGMWDVSKVIDMTWMFYKAQAFNQDLSQWCVPSLWSPESFDAQASAWTLPRPVWGTCPRGENLV